MECLRALMEGDCGSYALLKPQTLTHLTPATTLGASCCHSPCFTSDGTEAQSCSGIFPQMHSLWEVELQGFQWRHIVCLQNPVYLPCHLHGPCCLILVQQYAGDTLSSCSENSWTIATEWNNMCVIYTVSCYQHVECFIRCKGEILWK